eukprot:TRINITY_DN1761_c0_g2_i2.p2 TRINITY_DN1761_c0_g2~~TRINITY_DN1761_c0_g2_i2.p2  ORF type:complete len:153 (+),score=37.83 TRINITY_DN1761_c0_g2_i2:2-460(+)
MASTAGLNRIKNWMQGDFLQKFAQFQDQQQKFAQFQEQQQQKFTQFLEQQQLFQDQQLARFQKLEAKLDQLLARFQKSEATLLVIAEKTELGDMKVELTTGMTSVGDRLALEKLKQPKTPAIVEMGLGALGWSGLHWIFASCLGNRKLGKQD